MCYRIHCYFCFKESINFYRSWEKENSLLCLFTYVPLSVLFFSYKSKFLSGIISLKSKEVSWAFFIMHIYWQQIFHFICSRMFLIFCLDRHSHQQHSELRDFFPHRFYQCCSIAFWLALLSQEVCCILHHRFSTYYCLPHTQLLPRLSLYLWFSAAWPWCA